MKKNLMVFTVLSVVVVFNMAFLWRSFVSWNDVVEKSPFIFIARCKTSPEWMRATNGMVCFNPTKGVVSSDLEIISILKGERLTLNLPLTLGSEVWPYQGESYLIFGTDFDGKHCNALPAYRVVPLGHFFQTNIVTGKTLQEKVQFLLQYRLNHLNAELQQGEEEKHRLEQAFSK